MKHPVSAKEVAAVFVKQVVKLHGFTQSIVSDRDKIFLSHFWSELFKIQGTKLRKCTAFHPQTDGQTEIVNKCIKNYLRCFRGEQPKKWEEWLSWVEYGYNTTFRSSLNTTPFQVVYGRPPPLLLAYGDQKTSNNTLDQQLVARDLALLSIKEQLAVAQNRMKKYADLKHREVQFEVGDMVYLKLKPYRQRSLAKKRCEKLSPKYYGPYEIEERVGSVAYRLKLPPSTTIHNVFHVSQLKKALGEWEHSQSRPLALTENFEWKVELEDVFGMRWNTEKEREEWLVKWQDRPFCDATWEEAEVIKRQFLDFHLEDKVSLPAGGIVRPPIMKTYERRGKKVKEDQNERNNRKGSGDQRA